MCSLQGREWVRGLHGEESAPCPLGPPPVPQFPSVRGAQGWRGRGRLGRVPCMWSALPPTRGGPGPPMFFLMLAVSELLESGWVAEQEKLCPLFQGSAQPGRTLDTL